MSSFHSKVWGSEVWITNNSLYCGKILNFKKGHQSSLHFHKIKDETFYLLSGKIDFQLKNKIIPLSCGDTIRIKPGVVHRFFAKKDSQIIEVSTKHKNSDSIRIEKGF